MKNEFIKDPNEIIEYTAVQVQELKKCAEDPVYFAKNYIKIQHPTKGAIPLELYPYQVRCIEGFKQNRWSIVKCGRQMGKCVSGETRINTFRKPTGIKKVLLYVFFNRDYRRLFS